MEKVAIGLQNFEEIRSKNIFYVDKTDFIREWWNNEDSITLITRPRRFGKTLNLSTVHCFFSNEYAGRSDLFEELSIWKEESFRRLQGTFPVIFLSFAKIKSSDYEGLKYALSNLIFHIYEQNRFLLEGTVLSDNEKEYFHSIKPGMNPEAAAEAISSLTIFLSRYYGKDVLILLDEYDTPMQEAWLSGYWKEAAGFFRNFFNATFKTNPHMLRGLITGITRISKESVFSDLNNLEVITTTSEKYARSFGFTESEVFRALDTMGLGTEKQGVKNWYDGFTFGNVTGIYNPWSIINFISRGGTYDTYWADSSENSLVNSLIRQSSPDIKQKMELLLQGGCFETELDEQIIFSQLDEDETAIWSLLLATGYLKTERLDRRGRLLKKIYTLRLTNMEIESMFVKMIKGWFGGRVNQDYNDFVKALLTDDPDAMNEYMNRVALHSFSSFDTAKNTSHTDSPERFYHGFVLGLMADLDERFTITSNRESGFGRYDVMLKPMDKQKDNAYIFEFKVHKPKYEKNMQETLTNALTQIEEKNYGAALEAEGIPPENIRKYGFAFQGKQCLIGAPKPTIQPTQERI